MIKHKTRTFSKVGAFLLLSVFLATAPGVQADSASNQDAILKKLELMESEIKSLKKQLKEVQSAKATPVLKEDSKGAVLSGASGGKGETVVKEVPVLDSTEAQKFVPQFDDKEIDPGLFGINYRSAGSNIDSMRFGAYGETKFGRFQNEDGWSNGFDANRIVLLGTYPIADDILFNTEIEFEHGGIAKDADDKLEGAIEIEQLFVDFKINDYFNWRAPGVDIIPVGYVGLFHEPTQFYSVDRPELYGGLIPSTWFAPSTSLYGKLVDNVTYQFQVSSAVEDIGATGDDAGSKVPQDGYDAGISGTEALGLSRATISDNKQLSDSLAYAGRLAYSPDSIPGLAGSTSLYYTGDTTPRGAYGTNPNGSKRLLGSSDLTMVDTELRYRIPKTGLELRAEYVDVTFGDTDNLRANNNGDPTDNVGNRMYGYSLETAYHYALSKSSQQPWELVPFYRYTAQNLQTSGFNGTDLNQPTGAGDQEFHTFGFSLFPTPKLVLKLDYQIALDDAADSPKSNSILGGVGFFF